MINAPYNFVPLNKKVFYPKWFNQISHDVPFEDGESGIININITALSPIFIRNHYQKGDDYYENKKGERISKEFCYFKNSQGGKEYYIPGSSIKGMTRNLLEMMSFSKIRIDEEGLKKFLSVRDMTEDKKTGQIFNYPMVEIAKQCGFLTIHADGSGSLERCGKPILIHHMELKNSFNIKGIKNLKTAKDKYDEVGHKMLDIKVISAGRQKKAVSEGANKKGQLVLTGDIDDKKHEFVFIENQQLENPPLDSGIISNFKKVYFDNEEMIDGQYWKQQYQRDNNIRIPVFIALENKNVRAIGLTQIFKVAYRKTLFDAAKQITEASKLDLAETIFGSHRDELSLKGRVQFSHLKSTMVRFEKESVEQVLGTPNPTYYPSYIRQTDVNGNKVNKYVTLMDKNAEIAGWKQYPIQDKIQHYALPKNDDGSVKHDITTLFNPLARETSFEGKIRFHNLKKAEIGALLSALTFHGNSQTHKHNMGMAKSLGYGKVDIRVHCDNLKHSEKEYLDSFEETMNSWKDKEYENWRNAEQIVEILAMHDVGKAHSLRYQSLEKSDFSEDKKSKKYLKLYSGAQQKVISSSQNKNDNTQLKKEEKTVTSVKNNAGKKKEKAVKESASPAVPVKVYSMSDIAGEVQMDISEVIAFAKASTLPIPKNIDRNSELKEAQARGLINKIKKEK